MTPQRTVVVMTTLSVLVFLAGGGRVDKLVAQLRGAAPPTETKPVTVDTILAASFLFVFLMIMADLPPTSKLAVAFSYLIALSILLTHGATAFQNIANMTTPTLADKQRGNDPHGHGEEGPSGRGGYRPT